MWVFVNCVLFKNLNTCNDNMTNMDWRREMNKLLAQGIYIVLLFKASFQDFCDIDRVRISQISKVDNIIYTLKNWFFNKGHFNNQYFTKYSEHILVRKSIVFGITCNHVQKLMLLLLFWTYQGFVCVCKYDESQKKVIVKNRYIYQLVRYNQYVCVYYTAIKFIIRLWSERKI